ncbi:MAG: integration host factor subunit beta [Deltaproteobacteria bacterium]|nr:integration host factor subunit beta [Deltaproteobacteria bacterium]
MLKADLVATLARDQQLRLAEAKRAVDAVFSAMSRALVDGRGVEIRGFASFRVKHSGGYPGRNPRTGERIRVLPKRRVVFRPGAELRRRVNRGSGRR